ncbi:MAG: hypothetical protein HKM24_04140 [Gammaproteobacteria bacterium]|nr:hypothetical protein [Gammaproteobacteria bacterium]
MVFVFATTLLASLLAISVLAERSYAADQSAAATELSAASASFQRYLRETKNFSADFVQAVFESDDTEATTESGKVWVRRPDELRWDYIQPYRRSVLADGESVWEYDEDLNQAIVRPQADLIQQNPVVLLGDHGDFEKVFVVSGEFQAEAVTWLELTPRSESPEYKLVRLGFEEKELIAMEWIGNFDQRVRVDFSNIRRNKRVNNKVFQLALPEDAVVVRQKVL